MSQTSHSKIWGILARLILRNRILFLLLILANTFLLSTQWKHMRFSHTEANLLPKNHSYNIAYDNFTNVFGEEGNLILIATNDSSLFELGNFNAWIKLSESFKSNEWIDKVLHVGNIPVIKKDKKNKSFVLDSVTNYNFSSKKTLENFQKNLFNDYPFYENILFSENRETIQTAIYLKKEIINNAERIQFINEVFIPKIKVFEKDTKIDIRISGMPYIRTMNAQ